MSNQIPRPWTTFLKWNLLVGGLVLFQLHAHDASAQVLNQKVNALLANNCAGLGTGGFPTPDLTGLGANLAAICNTPQTLGSVSTGGGAASVQGSAASILNRALLGRLQELESENGERSASPSAMQFNPFGLLSAGAMRNLSVASPFYASAAGNGGSSAGFGTSTQSRWHGLGFFASGLVEALNRDVTTFQDGYKSKIFGLTAGADYRLNRHAVIGLAGNYSNTDGDFSSGGNFSTNSFGGLAFASIQPTDKTFVQMTAGYTHNNYLVSRLATANVTSVAIGNDRTVNGFASSNSNGNVFNAGLLTGYDHPVGRFTVGPRAGVNYSQTRIGSHAENGGNGIGLKYDDQTVHSLQSTFGIQGSTVYNTNFGVLVHQVNLDYLHEFANSQRHITAQFVEDQRATPTRFSFQNESPARDWANISTGLLAVLPNGWQPYVNFRAMVGNSQFNDYAGTFGLRIEL